MGRLKKSRWEDNEVSPSKVRSPTRYAVSDDYKDRDFVTWNKYESDLTEQEIDSYLQSTSHFPKDVALEILQKCDYELKPALDTCNDYALIDDLTPLEKKVLLAAAPIPCSSLGVRSRPSLAAEKHVLNMLPHIKPPFIRNFFNHVGRDGCVPPRGWVPKIGQIVEPCHSFLREVKLITEDSDSPLYEKIGKRILRSATITPDMDTKCMPRKLSKRNNLDIAMVGYGQSRTGDEDLSPVRSPQYVYPRMEPRSFSVEPSAPSAPSVSSLNNSLDPSSPAKRGRGRPRKDRVAFPLGGSVPARRLYSSRSPSPSTSSSSAANGSIVGRKKRDPLEIDMNWKPSANGARVRRPSMLMMDNAFFANKDKESSSNGNNEQSNGNNNEQSTSTVDKSTIVMEESTGRSPAGSDRLNGWRNSADFITPVRRNTRASSVSVVNTTLESSSPRFSRDKLHIDMVGWGQKKPENSVRDRDGFVIPRSPYKSPTRSRQPSPSPPASPEI